MSYEYLPLPKYLVTKAKIQYELGKNVDAIGTLVDATTHEFYESEKEEIDKLLKVYRED